MSRMIQLRNVPDELHRLLKSRSALAGLSLSDYLLREIKKSAERASHEDLVLRLEQRSAPRLDVTPAAAIRAVRERR